MDQNEKNQLGLNPMEKQLENELYMNGLAHNILMLDAKITALTNILITSGMVTESNCNLITDLTLKTNVYDVALKGLDTEAQKIKAYLNQFKQKAEVKTE